MNKPSIFAVLTFTTLISTSVFAINLQKIGSNSVSTSTGAVPQRLTPGEIDGLYQKAIKKTLSKDPDFFKKPINAPKKSTSNSIGDTHTFYALDNSNNEIYTTDAILKAIGSNVQIWVEVASWDSGYVNQMVVDNILDRLETSTPSTSIDPTKGIFEIDTTYFGLPPNYDGDNIVDFLILDIQDNYGEASSSYLAGYFWSGDQRTSTPENGSNARDMLYLDSYPGIYSNGIQNIYTVMGTAAHEFQHLIHYHYDQDETSWLNESMSQLAATYCGYGVDNPTLFLNDTDDGLLDWYGELVDYSQVNLWSLYLVEQYGSNFIKHVTQSGLNSVASIDNAMNTLGIESTFDETFINWTLCNLINDISVNPKWGYRHADMTGLHAGYMKSFVNYPASVSDYPLNLYGTAYYEFTNGDSLSILFTSKNDYAKLLRYYSDGSTGLYDLTSNEQYIDNEPIGSVKSSVLIIGNIIEYGKFSFTVNAYQSSTITEIKYDDGTPDPFSGGYTFLGTGSDAKDYGWANRFELETDEDTYPAYFKIYASVENGSVNIHIWDITDNYPDNDLITPFPVTLVDGWNNIAFPDEASIVLPKSFFMGFTHNTAQSNVYVGMDNYSEDGYTWLIRPDGTIPRVRTSNQALTTLNDSTYAGFNMMMRAIVKSKSATGIETRQLNPVAVSYSLSQNYPNPFNPTTTISYTIPKKSHVKIIVYDIYGHEVSVLKNEMETSHYNSVTWDSHDMNGHSVASGVYFYRIEADDFTASKKMLLIK